MHRSTRIATIALVVLGLSTSGVSANHLIPEETGASTETGRGSDAPGKPDPEDPTRCETALVVSEPEGGPSPRGADRILALELCVHEEPGGAVAGEIGEEQPGAADPDGEGLGRVGVSVDAASGRVQIYFEDHTPGNQVAGAIWRLDEESGCRLLPQRCEQPGRDGDHDDALVFTPVDRSGE